MKSAILIVVMLAAVVALELLAQKRPGCDCPCGPTCPCESCECPAQERTAEDAEDAEQSKIQNRKSKI
jgi:hypothetical protein